MGFTLCQTDDSTVLRHTVKALVKEPALSDGRIKPGDKLISASGQDCATLSHTDLIAFLRQIGNNPNEEIELRLYRDASRSQTPISPPTMQTNNLFLTKNQSNAKMATMSHPNLPSFLGSSNSNMPNISSSGGGSKHKRLRQEAKEMVRS